MPDVGEVRYKAKVDAGSAEEDIKEVEKVIGDSAEKAQKKVEGAADKASKKVKDSAKGVGDEVGKSKEKVDQFSDALGKVKGGPIDTLNGTIKETKSAISGVNEALERTPKGFNAISLSAEKVRLTRKEISDTKDKLKELKKAQDKAKAAFEAGEISKDTYKAISREVMETKSDLTELKKEGKEAYKELANTSAVTTGISKIGTAAKGAGSIGLTALKGIGTAFVGLTAAAGAGVTAVAKMGVEYNAQMQTYQTAFTTMLGDAEKAQALTDNLKTLAAKTPLAMTDLADASQILLAFGSSADELPDQLKRLGDVAQGDAQKLGTMATAFGRIQSNGYASLEEINMMIDQGFNPLQIIADKTGESMADVRKRVSEGAVSFEELSEALQTATNDGGQFYNAMQNQSETFEGQMSTLKDNVSALAGSLTEDLFAGLAETALPQVNTWVDELLTAAETDGMAGVVDTAGTVLSEGLTAILNAAPSFVEAATSLVSSFLGAVRDSAPQVTDGAVELIMTLATGFVDMIPEIISTTGTLILGFINGLTDHAPEVVATAGSLIKNLASGFIEYMPQIIRAMGELAAAILDALMDVDWLQVGKDVIRGLINGIGAMAGALWDAAVNVAKSALDGIKSFFGIASPSKVMRDQVGKQLDAGLAVGLEDNADEAADSARNVSRRVLGEFSADVNYNMPDVREAAKALTADMTASAKMGAQITVPVSIDGREVARATAWYMGEQLAWEERR